MLAWRLRRRRVRRSMSGLRHARSVDLLRREALFLDIGGNRRRSWLSRQAPRHHAGARNDLNDCCRRRWRRRRQSAAEMRDQIATCRGRETSGDDLDELPQETREIGNIFRYGHAINPLPQKYGGMTQRALSGELSSKK